MQRTNTTNRILIIAGFALAIASPAPAEPEKTSDSTGSPPATTTDAATDATTPSAEQILRDAAAKNKAAPARQWVFGRVGPGQTIVEINDAAPPAVNEQDEWAPVRPPNSAPPAAVAPALAAPTHQSSDPALTAVTGGVAPIHPLVHVNEAPNPNPRVPIIQLNADDPTPAASGTPTTAPPTGLAPGTTDPILPGAVPEVKVATSDIPHAPDATTPQPQTGPMIESLETIDLAASNPQPTPGDDPLAQLDGQYDPGANMQPLVPVPTPRDVAGAQTRPAPAHATAQPDPVVQLPDTTHTPLIYTPAQTQQPAEQRPLAATAAPANTPAVTIPAQVATTPVPIGAQAQQLGTTSPTALFDQYGGLLKVAGAVAIVVGLLFALAWLFRRLVGSNAAFGAMFGAKKAPSGIVEMLGRYPVGPKQSLVLMRFDRRVLLLSQSGNPRGQQDMTTLCELTEPEDVASVLLKVRDADGDTASKSFQEAVARAELQAGKAERDAMHIAEPDVVPGHRPPFSGSGGATRDDLRRVIENDDADRNELWDDAPTKTSDDPVGPLRRRLENLKNRGVTHR